MKAHSSVQLNFHIHDLYGICLYDGKRSAPLSLPVAMAAGERVLAMRDKCVAHRIEIEKKL